VRGARKVAAAEKAAPPKSETVADTDEPETEQVREAPAEEPESSDTRLDELPVADVPDGVTERLG